jgi:hypothetical protein
MDASQDQPVVVGPGGEHPVSLNRSVTARDFRPPSVATADVDVDVQVSTVPVRIDQRGSDVAVDLHVDHSCRAGVPPTHLDRGLGVEIGHALIVAFPVMRGRRFHSEKSTGARLSGALVGARSCRVEGGYARPDLPPIVDARNCR